MEDWSSMYAEDILYKDRGFPDAYGYSKVVNNLSLMGKAVVRGVIVCLFLVLSACRHRLPYSLVFTMYLSLV